MSNAIRREDYTGSGTDNECQTPGESLPDLFQIFPRVEKACQAALTTQLMMNFKSVHT